MSGANLETNTSSSPNPLCPNNPSAEVPATTIFCDSVTAIPAIPSADWVPKSLELVNFPFESTTVKIASVAPEFFAPPKFPFEAPPAITCPALVTATFAKPSSPELPTCDTHFRTPVALNFRIHPSCIPAFVEPLNDPDVLPTAKISPTELAVNP